MWGGCTLGAHGYGMEADDNINNDPVLRVCQRIDALEVGGGVTDADGVHITCDEHERSV